ncbi:helix-turn-helix domain-containing protein [Levilactobacillus bambusae]|uniref:Mga helix-turn-helix domain-containing protein n=1 Tax=Levilactobacillus bambusae TaxID=2024736 RepID=A0A2V1MYU8_9LACO|nr:helix-turn-helix domain-containing protein [Levilactobacillus bambusae]PWG00137.1 hypothetical protein DCM90_04165 [Levilactobacillus bambusae]
MELVSALLSKKKLQKIKLLVYLQEDQGNLKEYGEKVHFSYATVYNYYTELTDELREISKQPNADPQKLIKTVPIDLYRRWAYYNSVAYQLVLATLLPPKTTLDEFLADADISQATLYRKTRQLFADLKEVGIHFSFPKFKFTGTEQILQIFYLRFLHLTNTSINDEFSDSENQFLTLLLEPFIESPDLQHSDSLHLRWRHLMQIWLLRAKNGHVYEPTFCEPVYLTDVSASAKLISKTLDLSPETALTQAKFLDYIITNSMRGISYLTDLGINHYYAALGLDMTEAAEFLAAMPFGSISKELTLQHFQRRLLALGLYILLFEELPPIESDIYNQEEPTVEDKLEVETSLPIIERIYKRPVTKRAELLWQGVLAQLVALYNQSGWGVTFYTTPELTNTSSDIIAHWFHGIMHIRPVSQLPANSTDKNAAVLYDAITPKIHKLEEEKRIVGFHWIQELNYAQNMHRFEDFLITNHIGLFGMAILDTESS